MPLVNAVLDAIRKTIRRIMRVFARGLNTLSGGHLHPNVITLVGLVAHLPIAYLIATGKLAPAAILLLVFGLFDTLDGELARLQNRSSSSGMLLDATTDRMKEIFLYTAIAYNIVSVGRPYMAVWAVLACGGSLLVSYVKAKGETALGDSNLSANEKNRIFQDGFFRFEIRMALLFVGLLSNRLVLTVIAIAILAWITALQRLILIIRKLS
jgi:CDP-diacylglycerol---glycerol-3-phosphate 3-phosphatidyltransferase